MIKRDIKDIHVTSGCNYDGCTGAVIGYGCSSRRLEDAVCDDQMITFVTAYVLFKKVLI